MIDTSKYEGHTPSPWVVNNPDGEKSLIHSVGGLMYVSSADTRLIADAPLLLAEVKRLQEEVEERITAHHTLANGWSRAEQEWEQEKRRLLKQIEQLKEMNE